MVPIADEDEIRHREPPREVWRRSRRKQKKPAPAGGGAGRLDLGRLEEGGFPARRSKAVTCYEAENLTLGVSRTACKSMSSKADAF